MNLKDIPLIKNTESGNFFLMAGPCVIEGEEMALRIAEHLCNVCEKLKLPLIFKGSYKKANRSRIDSFSGIGDEKALKILAKVRDEFRIPVVTDFHSAEEAPMAAEYVDVLQVPAFLCRQTDILVAAAKTGKVVNIKKGQFLGIDQLQRVEGFPDFLRQDTEESILIRLHGKLHKKRTGRVEVSQAKAVCALDLQKTFHGQKGIRPYPGEQTPHGAAQVDEGLFCRAGVGGGEAGLLQPGYGVFHQVGVAPLLLEHSAHPLEDFGMEVSGALAKVGGDAAAHLLAVYQMPLVIHIQHQPDMARDG